MDEKRRSDSRAPFGSWVVEFLVLLGGELHADEGEDAESGDDEESEDSGAGSSQSTGGNFSERAGGGFRCFGDRGEKVGYGEYSFTCFGAEGSDHVRSDCRCAVPKGIPNVGEDGGGVFIGLWEDDIH